MEFSCCLLGHDRFDFQTAYFDCRSQEIESIRRNPAGGDIGRDDAAVDGTATGGIMRLRGLYFDSSVEAPMQSMELKGRSVRKIHRESGQV
jgi:hypothetical protein